MQTKIKIYPSKPVIGKTEKAKGDPTRRRGRKPIDVVQEAAQVTGRVSDRQAVWNFIRAQGKTGFTLDDVVRRTDIHQRTVKSYLIGLFIAGFLKGAPGAATTPDRFWLARDVGVEAPRVRPDGSPARAALGQESLWRSIRYLKTFNKHDIAGTADVKILTVESYLKTLLKAGYLAVLRKGDPRHPQQYRLVRNTGPKPPMVQRTKQVFDQNLNAVVWSEVEGVRDDF